MTVSTSSWCGETSGVRSESGSESSPSRNSFESTPNMRAGSMDLPAQRILGVCSFSV